MRQVGQAPDLVVIGAGAIGCAIAYYAARAGLKVTVIESRKMGGQGSSVAAGLIAPSPQISNDGPFAQIALASLALFPSLRDEILAETGVDIQLDPRGTLHIATTDEEAQSFKHALPEQQRLGLDVRWLSAQEALSLEPTLSPTILGAIYNPSEGQLNTTNLLKGYIAGAERHGAQFARATVNGLLTDKSRVIGVTSRGQKINAGHIVLATGAWTPYAEQWLHVPIPIRPQRGQLATVRHLAPIPHRIIFYNDIYVTPKGEHEALIGAANDFPGYVQTTTTAALVQLLTQGSEILPDLASASLGTMRAGLRPRTPDKLPIIGPVPGWEGVSIAAGHNSNGLLLSLITGQIITAMLNRSTSPIATTPHQLERFIHATSETNMPADLRSML